MSSKVRCRTCKSYVPKDNAQRIGLMSFCSDRCHSEWRGGLRGTKLKPPSSKTKTKPVRKKKSKTDIPVKLRQEVLEADGFRCRWCGLQGALHLHHIVYRSQGGLHERSNLISLCSSHHDKVHSDKKTYKPLCERLVELRDSEGDKLTLLPLLMAKTSGD